MILSLSDPDQIHPRLLQRLGKVVTSWAAVEELQARFLAFFLQADPGSTVVVTASVSGATLTDWLRTLATIRLSHEPSKEKFAQLLDIINKARSQRNALVHGLWQPGEESFTATVQTMKWERVHVVNDQVVTLADLDELADEIDEINTELRAIARNVGLAI